MITSKMFVQHRTDYRGSAAFALSAVCRGDENKSWAAATPAGSGESVADHDGVLGLVFANVVGSPEVYVHHDRDDDGHWTLDSCEFTYGGCRVVFTGKDPESHRSLGKFTYTVNAGAATEALRREFASSLIDGKPSRWTITFERA